MTRKAEFLPANGDTIEHYEVPEPGSDELTDEEKKLSELVEALNGEAKAFVSVHRESNGMSNGEFIMRIPVDKFDHAQILENLREEYGGGDYRLRVYVNGRVKSNKLFTIASKIKRATGTGQDDTLRLVMQQMEKMQQQMMQVMQEAKSGGASRMEMMQEMMLMKQIFGGGGKSGGVSDILEMVEGLKALGISVGVNEEKEDKGFTHLLEMAAPMFTQALQPQPVVQPRIAPVPQIAPTQQPKQADKMSMMIAAGLTPLVNAARKNSDPGIYAPMVLDNVPEETLIRFFNTPNGMAELIKIKPEIQNYLVWFQDLGEHVKAILGMPSKFSELYFDSDGDSVNTDIDQTDGANGTDNLHNAGDS